MDDFISRIEIIIQMTDLLQEEDREFFSKITKDEVDKINKSLSHLETLLKSCKISREKFSELQQKYRSDNYIMKRIFPYYWAVIQETPPNEN